MKILHVTDCYLPRLGGIEMHVHDLAARQRSNGHEVLVVTKGVGGSEDDDVPVQRLSCGPLAWRAGTDISRIVQERQIDVVHAHLSVASPLAWGALSRVSGVASVATVHSVVPNVPAALRSAIAMSRFPTSTVTFTAVSNAAARPWRRAMGDRMPVQVLHNGIDPAQWETGGRSHDPSTFTVVSVGRFARRKRHHALVGVLAGLRDRLPDSLTLRAVLIGDGPQLPAVRDGIARVGLSDQVELPGRLTRAQICRALADADAYAAPATLESFGIAALEARCAGVPVVAMKQGGAEEFITSGREGLLVGSDAEMAEKLFMLASDPVLRDRIARHNATTAPPMAWPAVLSQHEQVYRRALARADRPVPQPGLQIVPAL